MKLLLQSIDDLLKQVKQNGASPEIETKVEKLLERINHLAEDGNQEAAQYIDNLQSFADAKTIGLH